MDGKQKKLVAIVAAVVVLLVGVVFVMGQRGESGEAENNESTLPEGRRLPTVEKSVKVAVEKTPDGRKVVMTISGIPNKYNSIDYELSYDTADNIPRGVLGSIKATGPEVEKEIVLGSCSTNVCTYDEGVEKVSVSLKFNSREGSRIFEKDFKLE